MSLDFLNQLFSSPEFQRRLAFERGDGMQGGVPSMAQGQIDEMPMQQGNGLAQPLMGQVPQMQQQMQGLPQQGGSSWEPGGQLPAQPWAPQKPHGFLNTLGRIGDVMAAFGGQTPQYKAHLEQENAKAALAGFIDNPDQAIRNYMTVNPQEAIKYWFEQQKAQRGEATPFQQDFAAAGVNTHTPEGQATLRRALEARYNNPRLYSTGDGGWTSSPAQQPIFPQQQVQPPSQGQNVPVISSQEQYNALPPGTQYRDSHGNVRMKQGGAGQRGPRTFR